MDKTQLKKIIAELKKGDRLRIAFVSDNPIHKDAEYLISNFKTGRGKGGSNLLVLKNLETDEQVVIGTPDNGIIVSMTLPDGSFYGYHTKAEFPRVYPTNAGRASALKEQLKGMLMVEDATVLIDSTEPEFSGEFQVTGVEKSSGRYGQMVMRLIASDGTKRNLWSYRHSGIINSIVIKQTRE